MPITLADLNKYDGVSSWKDRNCPNMRTCWSFSWQAYDLRTSDSAVLVRRSAMWLALIMRTTVSILNISPKPFQGVLDSIIAIINFLFIAWCLATIGEAEGERRVLGKLVGRIHFDFFLVCSVMVYMILLIDHLLGDILLTNNLGNVWIVMWLLTFAVAWISTWPPEDDSGV
ncbi:hypothetical protein FDECE_5786 [Fusarium decemcellulare]|nr:hypothetical protein FDECE_5786 [Fusarium decemcellulare]